MIGFITDIWAQPDLNFEISYSEQFASKVFLDVEAIFPDHKIEKLYVDSLKSWDYSKENYFAETGDYSLIVRLIQEDLMTDSLIYPFRLTGQETDIEIEISFYPETNQKSNKGYVSICKYQESLPSINICLENMESSDYYKGPLFRLTNHSNDTIYGEYMPGYFWGTLSIKQNNSKWGRKQMGMIDSNFVERNPLYPDSSTIATVGSFGLYRRVPPLHYKFELLYSVRSGQYGFSMHSGTEKMEWWTRTREFYQLIYEFDLSDAQKNIKYERIIP